jgi:Zn-dependent protease with chaperone function
MLIPSQDRWVGAAIVGWIPGFRRLWIGDGLLRQLTEQQLDMVILHELAHVSRWHFLWRVSPALLAALAAALIWSVWPVETITLVTREMAAAGVAGSLLLMCLGPVARRCELDADRQAVLLATQHCEWVDGRVGLAASEMGAALISLLQPTPAAAQATWLHPSLAQRLRNLQGELR